MFTPTEETKRWERNWEIHNFVQEILPRNHNFVIFFMIFHFCCQVCLSPSPLSCVTRNGVFDFFPIFSFFPIFFWFFAQLYEFFSSDLPLTRNSAIEPTSRREGTYRWACQFCIGISIFGVSSHELFIRLSCGVYVLF